MTVNVGVIGVGMIGKDHIRRLTTVLAGAEVVAVTDVNLDEAKRVADGVPGAAAYSTGQELIKADDVDAVVVCSWGPTHEEYVLAAIEAGKPVFCEKPLATTQEACLRIIDAEVAFGRRLVQVGYMRRYDAAYRALKAVVDSGDDRRPADDALRPTATPACPATTPGRWRSPTPRCTTSTWCAGCSARRSSAPGCSSPGATANGGELQDPLFLLLELASGALVDVETIVNIRYGYDIRGEVVGENGTVALGEPGPVTVRAGQPGLRPGAGGLARAVHRGLRRRVPGMDRRASRDGGTFGPSTWDGYAAAAVSDAAVEALHTGERIAVELGEKPALYS